MADSSRRSFLKVTGGAGALGISGLAGCTSGGNRPEKQQQAGSGTTTSTAGDGATTTQKDPVNVGMVYALGGLGDKSFNDMANAGVKQAKEKYGIKFSNAEPGSVSEIKTLQRKFAQSQSPTYELVVCVGFIQGTPLKENAKRYSDQNFTVIDTVVDLPNVASYTFKEHQGSFQVGYLAGMMTARDFSAGKGATKPDNKVVGFVGGKEVPLIEKFQAGYMAGAYHADENTEVRSAYAGSWNDPAKGKEIALSMYDEGADIVYHAAGGTGIGVFKAAKERGRYAIGVDADQSKSTDFEEWILASMVKHVDVAVLHSIGNVVNGNFKGGKHVRLGLSDGGVEAVLGQQLGPKIPEEVTQKLAKSRKAIVNGDIEVPTKPKNA